MLTEITSTVCAICVFSANCILLFMIFPSRFKLPVSACLLILFTTAEMATELYYIGSLKFNYGGLRGLLYFPVLLYLLKGSLFQKLFAFFLELVLTVSFSIGIIMAVAFFTDGEGIAYNVTRFVLVLVFLNLYVYIAGRNRRLIFEKLFSHGSSLEWALYSFVGLFSFVVLAVTLVTQTNTAYIILLSFFNLLSFGVLCFAIVNTHEKTKQKADAEFARRIVSTVRDHYQKMNDLRDVLHTMRHDYKYHLTAAHQILLSGDHEEAAHYLTGVEQQLSEKELPDFCANTVINALFASYAERCSEHDIEYDVKIILPGTLTIPNYDMCIVFGNLLENAVEACEKQADGRKIEVIANSQKKQLVIKVKNSFRNKLTSEKHSGRFPVSGKPDGGLGLKSIQAVAARYNGELITQWDDNTFTAYVTLGL